jgi:hypothetical protein
MLFPGAWGKIIHEKDLKQILRHCPFKETQGNVVNFGSNRNKPKQDLFLVCFGLFRETKDKKIWFVSVLRTYIETTETNRTVW